MTKIKYRVLSLLLTLVLLAGIIPASVLAEGWTDTYAALLSKTLDTVQSADLPEINQAIASFSGSDYGSLHKLQAFRAKLSDSANFKDDYGLLYYYKTLQGTGAEMENTFSAQGNTITVKNAGGEASRLMLDTEAISPGAQITKISYELQRTKHRTDRGLKLIYAYGDAKNYAYLSIWVVGSGDSGHLIAQMNTVLDGVVQPVTNTPWLEKTYGIDSAAKWNVSFDYSAAGRVTMRIEENGHLWTGDVAIHSGMKPAFVIETQPETDPVTYSNVKAVMVTEQERAIGTKVISNYRKSFHALLNMTVDFVSVNYEDEIRNAIQVYDQQNQYVRSILEPELAHLEALMAKLTEMKGQGIPADPERTGEDYSDWTEDFENGLSKWTTNNTYAQTGTTLFAGSQTYQNLAGAKSATLYPKSYTLPDKAFIYEFTYDLWLTNGSNGKPAAFTNASYALNLYTSYVDADNWQAVNIFRLQESSTGIWYRMVGAKDGVPFAGTPSFQDMPVDFLGGKMRVKVTRNESGNGSMLLTDYKEDTYLINFSLRGLNGTFALGGGNLWLTPVYDNLTVKMRPGTWEDDQIIDDITVYYTGNTELHGDDVVSLIGDNLYNTVLSVDVAPVKNLYDAQSKLYNNEPAYDRAGVPSQYFTGKSAVDFWSTYTDPDKMKSVPIVQATTDSLKFILPKSLPTGVYAVRLNGFDLASSEDDAVVLINDADLQYYLGSDGSTVAPGGILQLVGENLCLGFADTDTQDFIEDEAVIKGTYNLHVKILGKNGYSKIIDEVQPQSNYSLKLTLPADVPTGEYEIAVYNGYGVGWSTPLSFPLAPSPRESWSKTEYNIRDFGATGDRDQNATPIFANAMTALAENGGGILYIPKGQYTLIHSIVIPENVQLRGEGVDRSIIVFNPEQWDVGYCPDYLIAHTGNVAIQDMAFYLTRVNGFLKGFGQPENVYIDNIRVHCNPVAGNPTGGTTTAGSTGELNWQEMRLVITKEFDDYAEKNRGLIRLTDGDNVRITNVQLNSWDAYGDGSFWVKADNSYFSGNEVSHSGWTHAYGANTVVEYNHFTYSTLAIGELNTLYHGNYVADVVNNNRELMVADGSAKSHAGPAGDGIVSKDPSDPTGRTYILTNYGRSDGFFDGWGIYVMSGQGMLQLRRVEKSYAYKTGQTRLVLDAPFTVEPNMNSRVTIRHIRNNNYYVSNYFYNGAATGYFGGFANVVYDSNLHERNGDCYQMARDSDPNWYLTYHNEVFRDAYHLHNYGSASGNDYSGFGIIRFYGDSFASSSVGFTMRGCESDGYHVDMSGYLTYALSCYTYDKNRFSNTEYMVSIGGAAGNASSDGVYFYKNVLNDVQTLVKINGTPAGNTVGDSPLITVTLADGSELLLGDVNLDGRITLRDAVLIQMYLSGSVELTEDQLAVADYAADGAVNLQDAVSILYYLANGIHPDDVLDDTVGSGGSGYFPGNH